MISSKTDYTYYLQADKIALGRKEFTVFQCVREFFFPDYIWNFQRSLRRLEYINNCKHGYLGKLLYIIFLFRFRRLSLKLGFSIPLNVFGPGLAIVHYGTIVINPNARVGANCRIHPSTCIGTSGGSSKAPQLGNNVYIAPGVKIFGDISLGNNIATAANAAVNKSFEEENILIGGVPAKLLKQIDITSIIKHLK